MDAPTDSRSPEQRAIDDLAFLRETVARASTFRQVPGLGMVLMGLVALAGSYVAALRAGVDWWLYSWAIVGFVGWIIGTVAMAWKAQRSRVNWWRGPGRQAVLGFAPAIFTGIFITEIFYERNNFELMPGLWLMIYGVALFGAAPFTVAPVRSLAIAFLATGASYFFWLNYGSPFQIGSYHGEDVFLALGFGGLHIVTGGIIALRHGG